MFHPICIKDWKMVSYGKRLDRVESITLLPGQAALLRRCVLTGLVRPLRGNQRDVMAVTLFQRRKWGNSKKARSRSGLGFARY
jgi:hypothetical protein